MKLPRTAASWLRTFCYHVQPPHGCVHFVTPHFPIYLNLFLLERPPFIRLQMIPEEMLVSIAEANHSYPFSNAVEMVCIHVQSWIPWCIATMFCVLMSRYILETRLHWLWSSAVWWMLAEKGHSATNLCIFSNMDLFKETNLLTTIMSELFWETITWVRIVLSI